MLAAPVPIVRVNSEVFRQEGKLEVVDIQMGAQAHLIAASDTSGGATP